VSFDTREFRQTLGRFATGVAVVTTYWQGQAYGMTVNSFTSVSLDPPLVLFCASPRGHTPRAIQDAGIYGVSILALDQLDLCKRLAGMTQVDELDRFEGLAYSMSPGGVPWMEGALAWLECRLEQVWEAGDHLVLLARVQHIRRAEEGQPLLFFNGQWPTIQRPKDGVG
jgi:flavin reductase (DIM6/NTAB) family NADH-FMN oxidoreductase RutF